MHNNMTEQEMFEYVLALSMQESQQEKPKQDPKSQGQSGIKSVMIQEYKDEKGKILQIRKGDLTQEDVDVIVNAANDRLQLLDGLAGAILKEGGKIIQKECDEFIRNRRLGEGEIFTSSSGAMKCSKVIHAVGPIWRKGQNFEAEILQLTVNNCLFETDRLGLSSISLPAISSGIFGFPKDLCAKLMIQTVLTFFKENPNSSVKHVNLTNFDETTVEIFENEFLSVFKGSKKLDRIQEDLSEEDMIKLAIEQSKSDGGNVVVFEKSRVQSTQTFENGTTIQLRIGDITLEDTDVIVNAANSRLDHSAGVAGAIVAKGGDSIQKECFEYIAKHGSMNEAEVFVSKSGSLKCKAIAHTIGPIWSGGVNDDVEYAQLIAAVLNCLHVAANFGFKSITFPAISTGKFGFPREACAAVLFESAHYFLNTEKDTCLNHIRFTVYDDDTLDVFDKIFQKMIEGRSSGVDFGKYLKNAEKWIKK